MTERFEVHAGAPATAAVDDAWDALAEQIPSPFLTSAWLLPWWRFCGRGTPVVAALRGADGSLRAAVPFTRGRLGLQVAGNDHAAHGGAVAVDDAAAASLWRHVGALPAPLVTLGALADGDDRAAADALRAAGRRVHRRPDLESPFAALPPTYDELVRSRSANLRSQTRRRRRALEREGDLRLRTIRGGPELERDLDTFLRLEASGWKASAGTAVAADPATDGLYREFARRAGERGWLRLHLLEIDGTALAGDLACTLGGVEFLVKTGFDEERSRMSPGLVLRAEVLRAAIEECLTGYDFLGGPDDYKLRWTDTTRRRTTVRGFRGARSLPAEAWWRAVRPTLGAARRRALERTDRKG